jgi:hypothetical protein
MTKKLLEGQALTDTGQLIELVDVINCKVLLERERERGYEYMYPCKFNIKVLK